MSVLIHQYINRPIYSCEAVQETILSLKLALLELQLEADSVSGGMTKKLVNGLAPYLSTTSWKERWPIDKSVQHNAYASYSIDYSLDEGAKSCGHFHRYFLQFMFDNRQAVGTNLMKFEIASRNSILAGRSPVC